MKYTDFLIEVKTKWVKKDTGYEREIIRYNCIPGEVVDKPIFASRYLNEQKPLIEKSTTSDNNGLIIHAINANTFEEITTPTDFINCLLEYTKYQWNYED